MHIGALLIRTSSCKELGQFYEVVKFPLFSYSTEIECYRKLSKLSVKENFNKLNNCIIVMLNPLDVNRQGKNTVLVFLTNTVI